MIIVTASPVPKKVKIFHSFKNLGGTRIKPTNKIVALDGLGCSATPTLFITDSLKKEIKFKTPLYTTLKAITESDSVKASAPLNGNKFNHASFIILPPFIAKIVLNSTSRQADDLLVEMNSVISSFDEEHKEEKDFNKANEYCRYIIKFLWGIFHEEVNPISTIIDCDDMEIENWCEERHNSCLLPSTSSSSNSDHDSSFFNKLALNVQSQTKVMENI